MKRKVFLFLMLIAVCFLNPINSYAYPTSYYLNVERVEQERTYWCWAACSVSVLDYYRIYVSQSDFCRTVKGDVVNELAGATEVSNGLYAYGLSSSISSALDLDSIKDEISYQNRPMIMGWIWNSGGGHMLVLEGFTTYPQEERLSYMDPADGRYHYATYSYVRGGYYSDHDWEETVYRFR